MIQMGSGIGSTWTDYRRYDRNLHPWQRAQCRAYPDKGLQRLYSQPNGYTASQTNWKGKSHENKQQRLPSNTAFGLSGRPARGSPTAPRESRARCSSHWEGELVLYLRSEDAGFITGTDILIDGGWCA
jgi:hypothetical protein